MGPSGLKSWRPSKLGSPVTGIRGAPSYPPTFTPVYLPHRLQSTSFGKSRTKGSRIQPQERSVHSGLKSFLFQDFLMWPTFNIFVEFVRTLLVLFRFFGGETCGILTSPTRDDRGLNPHPLHWKHRVSHWAPRKIPSGSES